MLRAGVTVTWTSAGNRKTGTITNLVPARSDVRDVLPVDVSMRATKITITRHPEDRYLILVPQPGHQKPRYYAVTVAVIDRAAAASGAYA